MVDPFDYAVRDSTRHPNSHHHRLVNYEDNAIRIGIVREEVEISSGETRYNVEVFRNGKTVPISCLWMSRFGGVHNFEEYRLRPWSRDKTAAAMAGPASAGDYSLRAGDVVLVTQLGGSGREGIILGGVTHPARGESTQRGDVAYHSVFQGIETTIDDAGTYRLMHQGKAVNTALLEVPPTGVTPPAPEYNPTVAGSYIEFDELGSFTATDDNGQTIKIKKQTGNIVIVSGDHRFEIGATDPEGLISEGVSVKTTNLKMQADEVAIKASGEALIIGNKTAVLAGQKVAIGNGPFELLDTIIKLIDAIGTVTVTSPVGTCTPLVASPQWSNVLLLKTLIEQSKASVPATALAKPLFLT